MKLCESEYWEKIKCVIKTSSERSLAFLTGSCYWLLEKTFEISEEIKVLWSCSNHGRNLQISPPNMYHPHLKPMTLVLKPRRPIHYVFLCFIYFETKSNSKPEKKKIEIVNKGVIITVWRKQSLCNYHLYKNNYHVAFFVNTYN